MAQKVLPPSPNWYLSSASASNEAGIYVFGARFNVYAFDISVPRRGPRLVGCYTGHTERVTSVALCPDGQLARPPPDTTVLENPLESALEGVEDVTGEAAGDDDSTLKALCCSGGDDMAVRIWDVNTRADIQCHREHKEKITSIAWSSVNTFLIASGDEKGDVILWNRKSQTAVRWRHEKDYVFCMAFCPHEPALLAIGVRQGTIFLVDFSSGSGRMVHRLRGHEEEVMSVSWCPIPGELFLKDSDDAVGEEAEKSTEGCLIATGSKDRTIRVWSCSRGRQLFYKKLPVQRRDHGDQGGRSRTWIAVHWLRDNPEHLVSSSSNGDLLLWNLKYTRGQSFRSFYTGEFRPHFRPIFNICASGPNGNTLCTFSQDRSLLMWDVANTEAVCSLPTIGGHGYCIRNSPVDPGRVAIGAGDNMIRVWNTSSKTNPYDITTHWQGIKNKVTAVGWHPAREATLGFGTEDGRVGVCDIFSQKMPVMSSTFHHRTVYVVTWGPSTTQPGNFSLYSVGDLKILEHTGAALSRAEEKAEAADFTALLVKKNSEKMETLKACEMSWNLDMNTFAVGTDDGTVYVFSSSGLKLIATIKVHIKLMNCVRWHPRATDQSPSGSPCQHWLASGGNDQVLHVVDLSVVFAQTDETAEKNVVISNSLRQFTGHTDRITDLSWSPHHDGRLVSVGYNAEAFVWDVQKGVPLCQFRGHQGRLLTCQFSGLDPDLVMTSGSDAAVMVWCVSEQPAADFGNVSQPQGATASQEAETAAVGADASGHELTSDLQDLQQMLDAKQAELMGKEGEGSVSEGAQVSHDDTAGAVDKASVVPAVTGGRVPESGSYSDLGVSELSSPDSEGEGGADSRGGAVSSTQRVRPSLPVGHKGKGSQAADGGKKKRRVKSYFPETAKADNRGKAAVYEDLFLLTRLKFR
ncbi:hypothetical protein BaRGS_00012277, partial [Batillaria attramentaria]